MTMLSKSKRKVKIRASELTDVDVSLISLVRRPASRIPFGLMKSETNLGGNAMIDLTSIFKREAPQPVVTAIVVNGVASAKLVEMFKAEGFQMDAPQDVDGVTIFPQDATFSPGGTLVKLSDDVAVAVSFFKGEGSFAEMCAEHGFYPSISLATNLLQDQLFRAVQKSDSPSTAADKISNLVGDFGMFMTSMIRGLPERVFKAEELLAKFEDEEDSTAADPVSDPVGEQPAAAVEEPAAVDVVEKAEDVVEGDPEVEAPVAAPVLDIAAIVAEVSKSVVAAIKPQLDEMALDVSKLSEQVGAMDDVVKSSEETLKSTVFGGVFNQMPDPHNRVEKSAANDPMPLLDTGFSRV